MGERTAERYGFRSAASESSSGTEAGVGDGTMPGPPPSTDKKRVKRGEAGFLSARG